MTDMNAAAQLQAWLDGTTSTLSKTAIRTVLWDLAEAQAAVEQLRAGTTEVWYFTDDDEDSSSEVYLDADAAKDAAVRLYASEYDPADLADEEFTWREFTPRGMDRSRWLLHHGAFTGWTVDSIRVAAPAMKAGA